VRLGQLDHFDHHTHAALRLRREHRPGTHAHRSGERLVSLTSASEIVSTMRSDFSTNMSAGLATANEPIPSDRVISATRTP
jgi:hypothetical protein